MIYTFFREDGFYPMEFPQDGIAKANAACNPGTIKVVNEVTRQTIYERAKDWPTGLPHAIAYLEQSKQGANSASEEFSRDEIQACLITLRAIHDRKIGSGLL